MIERVVCLNCIDGRAQLPVIHWIKDEFNVENVDMITEPGMDGLLADHKRSIAVILKKVNISIEVNQAKKIFIIGHHDCRGNPVSEILHKEQISTAVDRIGQEYRNLEVIGAWVNHHWAIEPLVLK
ncbi:MAG: hypothetical protein KC713_00355 [Candidatus Omnitrophica bacterium]|nr:hypothetical protein [Candidatus Omnitrophota bacterium]